MFYNQITVITLNDKNIKRINKINHLYSSFLSACYFRLCISFFVRQPSRIFLMLFTVYFSILFVLGPTGSFRLSSLFHSHSLQFIRFGRKANRNRSKTRKTNEVRWKGWNWFHRIIPLKRNLRLTRLFRYFFIRFWRFDQGIRYTFLEYENFFY